MQKLLTEWRKYLKEGCPVGCVEAPVKELFTDAFNAFKYQDFDRSNKQFEMLLKRSEFKGKMKLYALEYLGAGYWWHDKPARAQQPFKALLSLDPKAFLDPTFYPPQMVKDFELLKKQKSVRATPTHGVALPKKATPT
jgi:predicted Zn-dependent protease